MAVEQADLRGAWRSFLKRHRRAEVNALVKRYPSDRSLTVDILELHDFDAELTRRLLSAPDEVIRRAEEVLASLDEDLERVNLRLVNHPGLLALREVRSKHIAELVSIEGIVTGVGPVQSTLRRAVYRCRSCGATTEVRRPGPTFAAPRHCGDCGGSLGLDRGRSTFVDVQRLTVTEPPTERSGQDARTIAVSITDDLVGTVDPEAHVRVTGIVRIRREPPENRFDFSVDAVSVDTDVRLGSDEPERDEREELHNIIENRWQQVMDD